jgi:energy-coupling factor transport system permease protein
MHDLDARLKLFVVLFLTTINFLTNSFFIFGIVICILFVCIFISHVPFRIFFSQTKNIIILILLTSVLNIFFSYDGNVIIKILFIKITDTGLMLAIKSCIKLIIMILITSLVMLTTSPIELSMAITYFLFPLQKLFKLPVNEISMIITIALRFIPVLSNELEIIIKSQRARGIDFNRGTLIQRAKKYTSVLVPMFILSFNRSDELAIAMEARCYNPEKQRSSLNKLKFKPLDLYIFITILLVSLTLFVINAKLNI